MSDHLAGAARPAGPPAGAADASPGVAGAARPGWSRAAAAGRVVAGVLLAAVSVQAAVVECFFVPLHAGRWPVPVSVLAAVVGNVLLARGMARLTGRRLAALLPPVLWLVVVLVLAAPRPEGDVVVPGNLTGLAFLFLGATAGALGAAWTITPGRRWSRPYGP